MNRRRTCTVPPMPVHGQGRVTDAAGTPIAGIEVRRSSWGSDPSAVRTDTRGAYTFEADGNVLYMPPVLTFTDTDGPAGGGIRRKRRSGRLCGERPGLGPGEDGCTGVSSARASTSYSRRKPERSSMDGRHLSLRKRLGLELYRRPPARRWAARATHALLECTLRCNTSGAATAVRTATARPTAKTCRPRIFSACSTARSRPASIRTA